MNPIFEAWQSLCQAVDKVTGAGDGITERDVSIIRAMSPEGVVTEMGGAAPRTNKTHRDINMVDLSSRVGEIVWERNVDADDRLSEWIQGVYVRNDGSVYAISRFGGRVFRYEVTLFSDGEIEVGSAEEVEVTYAPIDRCVSTNSRTLSGTLTVRKQKDGRYAGVGIFSQSVLNKDLEIDSTALFDVMVERFNADEPIPDYYPELGGTKPRKRCNLNHGDYEFGDVVGLMRSGHHLLGYVVFDEGDIPEAIARGLEQDTEGVYGWSIEYLPDRDENGNPIHERVQLSPELSIPAFTAGTFYRASVLESKRAASYGTQHFIEREKEMNEQDIQLLRDITGGNLTEEQLSTVADAVGRMSKDIEDSGLVTRDSDSSETAGETVGETAGSEAGDMSTPVTMAQFENAMARVIEEVQKPAQIDRETITSAVAESMDGFEAGINERMDALSNRIEALEAQPTTKDVQEQVTRSDRQVLEDFLAVAGTVRGRNAAVVRENKEEAPVTGKTMNLAALRKLQKV